MPLLDEISELMDVAIREANGVVGARKKAALHMLALHLWLAAFGLLVMLLAIHYVLRRVVRPLEALDVKLRRIDAGNGEKAGRQQNEIDRLMHSAYTLERMFDEKSRLEQELREMAFHDALTRLPNRRLMEDRLRQKILRAERDGSLVALLFIDLDRFKPVNDEFGHDVGDWLLCEVADRIVSCIRKSDTAARIGGDEFVVLLSDLAAANDAFVIAEKIRASLERPFDQPQAGKEPLRISSSIGVAIYPLHADNEDDMLRLSDQAMFRAKKDEGGSVRMTAVANNGRPSEGGLDLQ